MQTHGGQAAEDAILSNDRSFRIAVYVDWTGNNNPLEPLAELSDYVESIDVERSLSGSSPEELLLVEGSSAAELTMVIGGEYNGMPLCNVFSRFNTASPLNGQQLVGAHITYQIILDTPVGPVTYQKFLGTVRTIAPDRASNTVTITALDYVEMLRKPVIMPQWATYDAATGWGEVDAHVAWSHAIIDNVLRNCDVGTTGKRPTTRAEMGVTTESDDMVQFHLPGNGSYVPSVGWHDNPRACAFPNRGKVMYRENGTVHPLVASEAAPTMGFAGTGFSNYAHNIPGQNNPSTREGVLRYWCASRDRIPERGTHLVSFMINDPAAARSAAAANANNGLGAVYLFDVVQQWGRILRIYLSPTGNIFASRFNVDRDPDLNETTSSQSWGNIALPNNTTPVEVFLMWEYNASGGSRVYLEVGSTNTGWRTFGESVNTNSARDSGAYNIQGRIQVCNTVDMSDVFYGAVNRYGLAAGDRSYLYRVPKRPAILDKGLNRLSHLPDLKTVEAWSVITEIAGAEFGSVFWDEYGVFRFWNQQTIMAKQTNPVRTITLDTIDSLNLTDTLDSVRNAFIVDAVRKRAMDTNSTYSSREEGEFETEANSTSRFSVYADNCMSPLTFRLGRFGSQTWNGEAAMPRQFVREGSHGYILQAEFQSSDQYGAGWYENNAGITNVDAVAYFNHDGLLTVRVTNPNNRPIRFAGGLVNTADDDFPALNIGGTTIEEYGSQRITITNDPSIQKYGEKTWELSGPWYQDTFPANNMVSLLMQRCQSPVPVADDITIPCDPRLQLGDALWIDDVSGYGAQILVQLIGIRTSWSRGEALTDTLTIEVVQVPKDTLPALPTTPDPTVPGSSTPRKNLCPNPELKNNSTGWFGQSGTRVTGISGFPESTTGWRTFNECITPQAAVQTAFKNHTYSVHMIPNFTGWVVAGIDWYRSGRYYSSGGFQLIRVQSGKPVRIYVSGTPADRVTHGLMTIRFSGQATFSMAHFEMATSTPSQPLAYFDGDTAPPRTTWDGTSGNSTSTFKP